MRDAEALGADLRATRESRELSLVDAEQQTRIRAYYLEALENGTLEVLPSPAQGKGFLRNYARWLGLDPEAMAARYDAALNQRGRRASGRLPQAAPPVAVDPPRSLPTRIDPLAPRPDVAPYTQRAEVVPTSRNSARRRRTVPNNAVALAGADARRQRSRNTTLGTIAILIISLIALLGIVLLSLYNPSAPDNDSTLLLTPDTARATLDPAIIAPGGDVTPDPSSATIDPNVTPSPARPSPLPNPNTLQPGSADGLVNVQISVKRRVALTIYADGKQVALGVFGPENILQYQATEAVRIVCGNADAIEVTVNGQVITDLGQSQQAIDRTFTAN
jgi:hypothetical protein